MKKTAIIFGGAGYIGRNLLRVFLNRNVFTRYIVCDIQKLTGFEEEQSVVSHIVDVRKEIQVAMDDPDPNMSWIFNFAAIHREPGHEFREYFDTNIPGAEHINTFARTNHIKNIFFTSSIAPYGKSLEKRIEASPIYPETAYGISKAIAERIHMEWLARDPLRRLIIVRPSVIFGPKDPGNVYRMIKALKKGTFILPNGGEVIKAYGYIYGLIDSIMFTMNLPDRFILYNYAENPLIPLSEMVDLIKKEFNYKKPTLSLSVRVLSVVAFVLYGVSNLLGRKTSIHPVRVRKAGFPTNIDPKFLKDRNFHFKYDLKNALRHWHLIEPEDF